MRYVRDHVCGICGETDWDNEAEVARHYVRHDELGEQPGDLYIGARVDLRGIEGTVTNITNDKIEIVWDDDELSYLPFMQPGLRLLAA